MIAFSADQWADVRALFDPETMDAETERARIAEAVALMETMAGAKAGTSGDVGGTGGGLFRHGQLDCYDEAINTSNFIAMLWGDDLLRFHRPSSPAQHGIMSGWWWPHATAVIEQIPGPSTGLASATRYAVDSWFHDNGSRPEVVTLAAWRQGWKPTATASR